MQITGRTTNPQPGLRVMSQLPVREEEYKVRAMPGKLRPPAASEPAKGLLVIVLAILVIGGLISSVAYLFLTRPNLAELQNQIKTQASTIDSLNKSLSDQKGRLDTIDETLKALPSKEEFSTFKTSLDELKKKQDELDKKIGLADKDQDCLPDVWEEKYGLNPQDRRDAKLDPDEDKLVDLYEYLLDCDPKNPDTDGDGYLDGQEVEHGYNPKGPGKIGEILKTKLTELVAKEGKASEKPKEEIQDQDQDGLPDDWERKYSLNPADPKDTKEDPDKDGLTNLDEYSYGTDPTKEDTDGDGYLDGEEVSAGYNPKGPGKLQALQKLKEEAKTITEKAEKASQPILGQTEAKEKADLLAKTNILMGYRVAKNYEASLEYLTENAEKNYKPEVIIGKTDLTWKPEVLDEEKKENTYLVKVKIDEYSGSITEGKLVDSFQETQTWIKQKDLWLLDKIEGNKYQ